MSTSPLSPTTTWPTIVGFVLLHARSARGLHQADVAAAVGVTQSTWSRIERGESALTIDQLALAADALGTQPERLIAQAAAVRDHARSRGIKVEPARSTSDDLMIALIGAAALGALVGAVFSETATVQRRHPRRARR